MITFWVLLLLTCSVVLHAQDNQKEILITGTLESKEFQFSFSATSNADSLSSLTFDGFNLVVFGESSTKFHNHPEYPKLLDERAERELRLKRPQDAKFFEKQNFGLSLSPEEVSFDDSGNIDVRGNTKGSFGLLRALYPVPYECDERNNVCDDEPTRKTDVYVTGRISSSGGIRNDVENIVRWNEDGRVHTLKWDFEYSVESKLTREERSLGFKDYTLKSSTQKRFLQQIEVTAALLSKTPAFVVWSRLKVQPIGIEEPPTSFCTGGPPCFCCTMVWLPDYWPTGNKGLNFGKPQADNQWSKAKVTFNWLPLINITDGGYKIIDSDLEEDYFFATYSDSTAVEIFFMYQFDPVTKHGGGFTRGGGTADAKIMSNEFMIDDCPGVDVTHLAHELGHVLDLAHPLDTSNPNRMASSTNTLMCPSGYCNDNPQRNSFENQQNKNNPLLTFYLGPADPADDCTSTATNCGACP